jgi:TatD DNase family protein
MFIDVHTHKTCLRDNNVLAIKSFHILPDHKPDCFFSYGLHPWYLDEKLEEKEFSDPLCVAIGECGLDGIKSSFDIELQKKVFIYQLELARNFNKPVVLHLVRALDHFQAVLKNFSDVTFIWHGFLGKQALYDQLKKNNIYFSFGPYGLREEGWKSIPVERIFVETDESERSIRWFYERLAQIKEISLEELENKIEENARRVFGSIFESLG